MMYDNLIVTTLDSGVGMIQFNRPKAYNALNPALMMELGQALQAFDEDEAVKCIVLTGSERAFAAGADIKAMAEASSIEMLMQDPIAQWDHIRKVRIPVIAAVSGYCLGGGCELAMSCDMIIASETAQFGQPEINLGIIPGFGGTQRLTHALGKARAMEMVLTASNLTAEEAMAYGLVNHVYPLETYLEETIKLAARVAGQAPVAVQLAKDAVNKAYELNLSEGLHYERLLFQILFASDDQKEGMSAFIEKRKAAWTGH